MPVQGSSPVVVEMLKFTTNPFASIKTDMQQSASPVVQVNLYQNRTRLALRSLKEFIVVSFPMDVRAANKSFVMLGVTSGSFSGVRFNHSDMDMDVLFVIENSANQTTPTFTVTLSLSGNSIISLSTEPSPSDERRQFTIIPSYVFSTEGEYALHMNSNSDEPVDVVAHLVVITCVTWNEEIQTWSSYGCEVATDSYDTLVHCGCSHLSIFSMDWFVMPNRIDIVEDIKLFDKNLLMVVGITALWLVYALLMLFTHWMDVRDERKRVIYDLNDNSPLALYPYIVTIWTGVKYGGGTSASVGIIIKGSLADSEGHILTDVDGIICQTGGVDTVILRTMHDLGELKSIVLWHDDSGNSPDWYISHIVIQNLLKQDMVFVFLCYHWLSSYYDAADRIKEFPVAMDTDLRGFRHVFSSRLHNSLRDDHLWFSVLMRPPRSNFTRKQRLSCCFSLITSTFLASIMFFGIVDDNTESSFFNIKLIMISLESSMLVALPNIILIQLFRAARRRNKNVSIITRDIGIINDYDLELKSVVAADDIGDTLGSQGASALDLKSIVLQLYNLSSPRSNECDNEVDDREQSRTFYNVPLRLRNGKKNIPEHRDQGPSNLVPVKARTGQTGLGVYGIPSAQIMPWDITDDRSDTSFDPNSVVLGVVMLNDRRTRHSSPIDQAARNEPSSIGKPLIQSSREKNQNFSANTVHRYSSGHAPLTSSATTMSDDPNTASTGAPRAPSLNDVNLQYETSIGDVDEDEDVSKQDGGGLLTRIINRNKNPPPDSDSQCSSVYSVHEAVKEEQSMFLLPWWCCYIAWILHFATSGICTFFTLIYGLNYGPEKSLKWLITIVGSLVFNITVVQSLKLTVMALALALILNNFQDVNLIEIHAVPWSPEMELEHPLFVVRHKFLELRRSTDSRYKPVNPAEQPPDIRSEIFSGIMFSVRVLLKVGVLLAMLTQYSDPQAYILKQRVRAILKERLTDVMSIAQVNAWINYTVLPEIYGHTDKGNYTDTVNSYRMTPVMLRQIRRKASGSTDHRKGILCMGCVSPDFTEITDNFNMTWRKFLADTSPDPVDSSGDLECSWMQACLSNRIRLMKEAWMYRSRDVVYSLQLTSQFDMYPGGGYVASLGNDYDAAQLINHHLYDEAWIDQFTWLLFAGVTFYNVNRDIFILALVVFEFSTTGGIMVSERYETTLSLMKTNKIVLVLAECVFMVLTCWDGYRWFQQFRNSDGNVNLLVHLHFLVLTIMQVSTFLIQGLLAVTIFSLYKIIKLSPEISTLQNVIMLSYMLRVMLAIQIFIALLHSVSIIVRISPKMHIVIRLTKKYWDGFVIILVYIFLVISGFTFFFYLSCQHNQYEFYTLSQAYATVISYIGRELSLNPVASVLVKVVAVICAFFVRFILLNCLTAYVLFCYKTEVSIAIDKFKSIVMHKSLKRFGAIFGFKLTKHSHKS